MSRLLDSVILIDHFNGVPAATRYLRENASEQCISAITRAEVLAGFDDSGFALAVEFLNRFRFLPMDAAIADEAAVLRRRTRLKLPDAIQAAFATCHGLRLVTRNTSDFPKRRFPFVEVPYRLA